MLNQLGRYSPSLGATTSVMASVSSIPSSNLAHVRILSINDFHGQVPDSTAQVDGVDIGGAATLSAYAQRERAGNPNGTVFVAAGDLVGASPPESSLLHHESSMAVLGAMGLDLSTFGNHEFDRGYAEIIRLIRGDGALAAAQRAQGIPVTAPRKRRRRGTSGKVDGLAGARMIARTGGTMAWPGSPFPWVNSNVVDKHTGKPVLPPYVIKDVDGVKVAFVGATTKTLKQVTLAKGIPNIKAKDPVATINALVPEIKAKGAQTIVVVIHEGGDPDPKDPSKVSGEIVHLAEALDPMVSVIVSGHTHKEYATKIAGKVVVQAGNYAKALGEVDLTVDRSSGRIVSSEARLIRNDEHGIQPDPKVAAMVSTFEKAVAPKTQRVVTTLKAPLTRTPSKAGETTLGSLIADAQRAYAKTDVALMNPGGIRQDLTEAGPLKWGTLFGVQPFANVITRIDLTGAELREVLEQQFPAQGEAKVLQISGMTVHVDMTKPVGHRIGKVVMADGSELNPTKTYSVAANSFLTDGGDGFTALKKGRRRKEIGVDLDALVKYLESGGKVPTGYENRVVLDAGTIPVEAH